MNVKENNRRTVLITGATRGIGLAIAKAMLEEGYFVVATGSCDGTVCKSREDFKGTERIRFYKLDVRNISEIEYLFKKVGSDLGLIDVLVNNAGILDNSTIETLDEETWDSVIDINLKGYFFTTQAALPYLKKSNHPRIINISSNAGRMGGFENGLAYTASKGGINALTYGLARRLAKDKITVNCVAPGTIVSEMSDNYTPDQKQNLLKRFPIGRMGKPDEVAEAVCYLASVNAGFTTGAIIDVNGGLFMG